MISISPMERQSHVEQYNPGVAEPWYADRLICLTAARRCCCPKLIATVASLRHRASHSIFALNGSACERSLAHRFGGEGWPQRVFGGQADGDV
jgi:hypothetical protein